MRYLSITCPQRVRVANLVFEITLSQAITLTLLLVCSFSPRVHSIPRGPQNSLKRREFDVFKPHKYTVSCGDPVTFLGKFLRGRVRVANLVFEITLSQAITLTLLLVCSFSPRVHSIPRGPLFSRVFGFPKKLKRSRNSAVFLLRKGAEQQPSPLFTYSIVSTTRLVCDCAVFRR